MTEIRPLPDDPDGDEIRLVLHDAGPDWLLAAGGDVETFAAETMTNDGASYQRVITLCLDVRRNHQPEVERLQLMIDPEDLAGIIGQLVHSLRVEMATRADD